MANGTQKLMEIPVEKLLLDPKNPRLSSILPDGSQEELLRLLWNEMAVDEIALSIAANGYFPEEPLIVIAEPPPSDKYVVLEGNRRLAAVRILRDPDLRKKLKAKLPELTPQQITALDKLPASRYPTREDLWQYYGFRHINGPKSWDPYSKAQFIADVFEKQNVKLDQIAYTIGDRHQTVQRLYRGFVVLRQAEKAEQFDREDRVKNRFNFNYLYTAIDQVQFQKFIGIDSDTSLKPDPVPAKYLPNLRLLLLWLYGSKKDKLEPLVKSQTADLKRLREIIADSQALVALQKWYSLDKAYEVSVGDEQRFAEAITTAKEALLLANGTVTTGYKGQETLLATMGDIVEIAKTVYEEMQRKREKAASPKKR